jgi:molybdenum cofactor cytidylyltransferase
LIAAVVLAAGASSRLGRAKQLVEVQGSSLVRRAVEACLAAGCTPVVAVVGHEAGAVRRALDGSGATIVENADWSEGMASSIRAGVAGLDSGTRAVVLAVCDQPAFEVSVVRRLIEAWDGSDDARVACAYAATLGVPALFGRTWFERLSALHGRRGAKGLLRSDVERVVAVEWPEGAVDLDEP